MELPKIVRESSIEGRNKQVEAKMLDMGWQHSHHGRAWNSYRKGEFYLDSFWPEPELVVEEAKKLDERAKAGAIVLAQYMDILGK